MSRHDYDRTRASWNLATRNHNRHKGDQAARLRAGEDPLFPEELDLLGELAGQDLVHLQCNAGQDSLGLARRGARVHGVDLSDEAIAFAEGLARASEIPATFERAEVVGWMAETAARYDLAFSSYGAAGWLPELEPWAAGIARILRPGGAFVYVEFHPLVWSIGRTFALDGDPYFTDQCFEEPVGDYVAASGAGLGASEGAAAGDNPIAATAWQHTLAAIVDALAGAGLRIEALREYPYANGCRVHPGLVAGEARRWVWPPGVTALPLMFGLRARKG